MTAKEVWGNFSCAALSVSAAVFLWRVGSAMTSIANTVNKWDPENIENHANHFVDHAADRINSVVDHAENQINLLLNNAITRINAAVANTISETGNNLSKQVKDIVTDTSARLGVTVAEVLCMLCDANAGVGMHFVGKRPDDAMVRTMVKNIILDISKE